MEMAKFQQRLKQFFGNDEIPKESTLRRWAMESEGLIRPPKRLSKGVGGGKGRRSNWSDEAFEDAAACWYIRQVKRPIKRPSIRALNKAREQARRAYTTPFANPFWLTEEPSGFQLYPLVVRWICTIEKIRHNCSLSPVRVAFNWSTDRARTGRIDELVLDVVLEKPGDFTKELSDYGRFQYGSVCEAYWATDRFSTLPNEDQVVFRLDGSNTIGHSANGIINMLGAAGIEYKNLFIVQKRRINSSDRFWFYKYASTL